MSALPEYQHFSPCLAGKTTPVGGWFCSCGSRWPNSAAPTKNPSDARKLLEHARELVSLDHEDCCCGSCKTGRTLAITVEALRVVVEVMPAFEKKGGSVSRETLAIETRLEAEAALAAAAKEIE